MAPGRDTNTGLAGVSRSNHPAAGYAPAPVIAFSGAKGGVGSTTMAVETASALSDAGLSVIFIDLDIHSGDAHYRLDAPVSANAHTAADLLPVMDELDGRMLSNAFQNCPCGVLLLPSPACRACESHLEREHVPRIVDAARDACDIVILDTASGSGGVALEALRCSDLPAIIVTPEVSCLGATLIVMEKLEPESLKAHVPPALIINRSLERSDLVTTREIEEFLSLRAFAVIPESTAAFRRAADQGRTMCSDRRGPGRLLAAAAMRLYETVMTPVVEKPLTRPHPAGVDPLGRLR